MMRELVILILLNVVQSDDKARTMVVPTEHRVYQGWTEESMDECVKDGEFQFTVMDEVKGYTCIEVKRPDLSGTGGKTSVI